MKRQTEAEAARAFEAQGKVAAAAKAYAAAIRKQPRDAALLLRYVRLLNRRMGDPLTAEKLARQLVRLAPNSAAAQVQLAEVLTNLGRPGEALKVADRAVKLAPSDADTLYVAATVHHRADRPDSALALLHKGLQLAPDHLPLRLQMAETLASQGDLEGSAAAAREILKTSPGNPVALRLYVTACRIEAGDPVFAELESLLASGRLPAREASRLGKLRAKALTDLGRHDEAFAQMTKAKKLAPGQHDGPAYRRFVAGIETGVDASDFEGFIGADSDRPVFVLGMPRSGSTLIYQILTRHTDVAGIGESHLMGDVETVLGMRRHEGRAQLDALEPSGPKSARSLAGIYLRGMPAPKTARRVLDKLPHNFERLALIARLFPNARVIHTLRDPLDTCVSCYMARFNARHGYADDLVDLGRYYVAYRRLMDHWRRVLPLPILDVRYEDVVSDTEGQARRAVEFLGLEWDPACLDHQKGDEVRTLSVAQVRAPIYTSSVERWRRYEAHIGPLKAELAAFYDS